MNQLTKQKVAVLPSDMKMMLKIFAGMKKNDEIERWIEECPEDRSTIEWTEEEEIPGMHMFDAYCKQIVFTGPSEQSLPLLFSHCL